MNKFEQIKRHSQNSTALSKIVVDDFLIYYAAMVEDMENHLNMRLKKFQHFTRDWPASYLNYLKSEFIASRLFREGGLIGKYLNHSALKNLPAEQYAFLQFQHEHPWKFSFAEVVNNPEEEFYEMRDVFSGEEYLLYSPGMKDTLKDRNPILWFNLIGFNGKCWQTFGLILGFSSFDQDDIFFFGTEINPSITNEIQLMNEVHRDPLPFFMLLDDSTKPLIVSKGYQISHWVATDEIRDFSTDSLGPAFTIGWNKNVYQLNLKKWCEAPHFATAYYDEKKNSLYRYALTEKGFEMLSSSLNEAGFDLNEEADIHVSINMVTSIEKILKKKLNLNPYDTLFQQIRSEGEKKMLEKMNHFLSSTLPALNEGKAIDLEKLAAEAGLDLKTARELWEIAQRQVRGKEKKS